MLDTLRLVKGAVSTKDFQPILTHFMIDGGWIQGNNGRLAISARCGELEGITAAIPGKQFVDAVDACEGEPKLTLKERHLLLTQGALRVRLPLADIKQYPRSEPDLLEWETDAPLLPVLAAVVPFIAADASRPWSIGMWVTADYAYATNNVILVRGKTDFLTGTDVSFNLPIFAVNELLRIGKEPVGFGFTPGQSITFYYADQSWLKTQVLVSEWPMPTVEKLLEPTRDKKIKIPKVPDGLAKAVQVILPFAVDQKFPLVVFGDNRIATPAGDHGAELDGYSLPKSTHNAVMLKLVLADCTHLLLREYPALTLFRTPVLDGVLVPVRDVA